MTENVGSLRLPSRELRVGAPGGIRNPNLLIRSQMLYPLSYGRMAPEGLDESNR